MVNYILLTFLSIGVVLWGQEDQVKAILHLPHLSIVDRVCLLVHVSHYCCHLVGIVLKVRKVHVAADVIVIV